MAEAASSAPRFGAAAGAPRPPERGFYAAYVRLSRVGPTGRSSPASPPAAGRGDAHSFPVKSIVRKYKDDESGRISGIGGGGGGGASLLSAADWAESLLLNNIVWLVQLAIRGFVTAGQQEEQGGAAAVNHDPRLGPPVVVSLGDGCEVLILWDAQQLEQRDPLVLRVNVALTVASDDEARDMDGHELVQRYGCLQPRDCLYEHVQYEVDLCEPRTRPTIYLSTEHVPWALSPDRSAGEAHEDLSAAGKRRVLRIHTSSSTGHRNSFIPDRVESLPNPDLYFAAIRDHEASLVLQKQQQQPPPQQQQATFPTAVAAPVANDSMSINAEQEEADNDDGDEDEDDDDDDDDDDESSGSSPPPAAGAGGFYPRELLILAHAYRDEALSEREAKWDVAKVTQTDIKACDRLIRDLEGRGRRPSQPKAPMENAGAATADPSPMEPAGATTVGAEAGAAQPDSPSRSRGATTKMAPASVGPSSPKLSASEKPASASGKTGSSASGTGAMAAPLGSQSKEKEGEGNATKKKLGRPKGSKNKPKEGEGVAAGAAARDAEVGRAQRDSPSQSRAATTGIAPAKVGPSSPKPSVSVKPASPSGKTGSLASSGTGAMVMAMPPGSQSNQKEGEGGAGDGSGPSEKKRGRPKGSKNRPKEGEGGGEALAHKAGTAKAGDSRSEKATGEAGGSVVAVHAGSKKKEKDGKSGDMDGSGPSEKKRGRPKGSKNRPKGIEGDGETLGNRPGSDSRTEKTGLEAGGSLPASHAGTEGTAGAPDGVRKKKKASKGVERGGEALANKSDTAQPGHSRAEKTGGEAGGSHAGTEGTAGAPDGVQKKKKAQKGVEGGGEAFGKTPDPAKPADSRSEKAGGATWGSPAALHAGTEGMAGAADLVAKEKKRSAPSTPGMASATDGDRKKKKVSAPSTPASSKDYGLGSPSLRVVAVGTGELGGAVPGSATKTVAHSPPRHHSHSPDHHRRHKSEERKKKKAKKRESQTPFTP